VFTLLRNVGSKRRHNSVSRPAHSQPPNHARNARAACKRPTALVAALAVPASIASATVLRPLNGTLMPQSAMDCVHNDFMLMMLLTLLAMRLS